MIAALCTLGMFCVAPAASGVSHISPKNATLGSYVIDTVAGGLIDTIGTGTNFGQQPFDVVTSGQDVYSVDNYDSTVWELNDVTGVEKVVAGNGTQGYSGDGGPAAGAELYYPVAIAVDGVGNIFIADSFNQRIRVVASSSCSTSCMFGLPAVTAGDIYTIAGDGFPGYSGDGGLATAAGLYFPAGLAVDSRGDLLFADSASGRVRLIASQSCSSACPFGLTSLTAGYIYTVAGDGSIFSSGDGGPALLAGVPNPVGIAIDPSGNLLITDSAVGDVRMIASTSCSSPSSCPYGLAMMTAGDIYNVAGGGSAPISQGATAIQVNLWDPSGVAVDAQGNLLIGNSGGNNVLLVASKRCPMTCPYGLVSTEPGDIYIIAGTGMAQYSGDGGVALRAGLYFPDGLAIDSAGDLVIADSNNYRIRIVPSVMCDSSCPYNLPKLAPGDIYTVAGNGYQGVYSSGAPRPNTQLRYPAGLAFDARGDLLIDDSADERIAIVAAMSCSSECPYGFTSMTYGDIYTLAGDGLQGYSGDGGLAAEAELSGPGDIIVDTQGNVIIADSLNNRVRMVAASTCSSACPYGLSSMTAGDIYTIAGTGSKGFSGDGGPSIAAKLYFPSGLAFDPRGDLLVADQYNNRIRLIATSSCSSSCPFQLPLLVTGNIYTIAGNGAPGYAGDSGPATQAALDHPNGIAVDSQGNLIIADTLNNAVRLVATSSCQSLCPYGTKSLTYGDIYTLAGNGASGYSGDNGPSVQSLLNHPLEVTTDSVGNILVSDTNNNALRVISSSSCSTGCPYGLVSMQSGFIYTIAGNGTSGFSGDGGSPAYSELSLPIGITSNSSGDLFIADAGNGRVREIFYDTSPHLTPTAGTAYWVTSANGYTVGYGSAPSFQFPAGLGPAQPIVGAAVSDNGEGSWLLGSGGDVFTLGTANLYGSAQGLALRSPMVSIVATPDSRGYWLAASDGGVFAYGDAVFYGSVGSLDPTRPIVLNKPVVGIASTSDGRGYWLVASDGGIFTFGDAHYYGSTGATHLSSPVVGMASTPDGRGYWLVASDGGIFTFGDAPREATQSPVQFVAPTALTSNSGQSKHQKAIDGGAAVAISGIF